MNFTIVALAGLVAVGNVDLHFDSSNLSSCNLQHDIHKMPTCKILQDKKHETSVLECLIGYRKPADCSPWI